MGTRRAEAEFLPHEQLPGGLGVLAHLRQGLDRLLVLARLELDAPGDELRGELELKDVAGQVLSSQDYDPAPSFGATFEFKF